MYIRLGKRKCMDSHIIIIHVSIKNRCVTYERRSTSATFIKMITCDLVKNNLNKITLYIHTHNMYVCMYITLHECKCICVVIYVPSEMLPCIVCQCVLVHAHVNETC